MTEDSSTASHLSVAVTTEESDANGTQATNGSGTTSSSVDFEYYFKYAAVFIGVVGMAGNALIIYALVASKQHKKHVLIFNQNVLDLLSSFFLVVSYGVSLCDVYLTGAVGHYLCVTILGETLIWWATNCSVVNLVAITIDRYLKVVHPIWIRKRKHQWMTYSAVALSWLVGIIYNIPMAFITNGVVDGVCYSYVFFDSQAGRKANGIFYVTFFYFVMLTIFIFCYGHILVAIRRQASVMTGHSGAPGTSSTQQTQSNKIQTNVIKTMVLVCAFYAVTRLPTNIYVIVLVVDPDVTRLIQT